MACGGAFHMLGEVEFITASTDAVFFDSRGTTSEMRPIWTALEVPRTKSIALANLFTRVGSDVAAFKAGRDRFASGERPQWHLR